MRIVTLISEKYIDDLHDCYINIDKIKKTKDSVSLPECLLLPSQLAKLMIKIIVERNALVKGLPEAQSVILQFAPYSLELLIKDEIKQYFLLNNKQEIKLNVEGFVSFRLKEYADLLNDTINEIIRNYVVQEKYYNFLNMMRDYIDQNEPVADEMHISPKTRFENAGQTLETLIELLPKKLIIYNPDGFVDKNLLRCIEYVFFDRIVYL